MPQFESEPTLSVVYTQAQAGQEYDYSGLSLIDALTDASQVQVRWNVTTVYIGGVEGVGTAQPVNELPVATQEAIYVLDETTQYTVDPDGDTITIIPAGIENQSVTVGSSTYYYPASFTITPAQNLELRRSTDVTTKVVNFQPGGRLTAEQLNLSTSQSFNAIQELTQFGIGSSGSIGDVDLSLSSINDLGDVNLTVNGLLGWDGATVTSGTASGTLVPDPSIAQGGMVLSKKDSPYTGDPIEWKFANTDDILYAGTGTYLTTIVGDMDTDVTNLESKTAGFTRNAGSVLTTFSDSVAANAGIDVNTGNVDVKVGDVLIQGLSTYDAIKPYIYLHNSLPFTSTAVTGAGTKKWFLASDWDGGNTSYTGSTEALGNLTTTPGLYTANRTQKIKIDVSFRAEPTSGATLFGIDTVIYHTPVSTGLTVQVGPTWRNRKTSANSGTAHSGGSWFIELTAGDTISIESSRTDSANPRVIEGTLAITEIR